MGDTWDGVARNSYRYKPVDKYAFAAERRSARKQPADLTAKRPEAQTQLQAVLQEMMNQRCVVSNTMYLQAPDHGAKPLTPNYLRFSLGVTQIMEDLLKGKRPSRTSNPDRDLASLAKLLSILDATSREQAAAEIAYLSDRQRLDGKTNGTHADRLAESGEGHDAQQANGRI